MGSDQMIDEDTVWYYTWRRLVAAGIEVIGGEPPGGSSPLPRIEMKDPGKTEKGSRGSRKCDLYAVHESKLLLIEAKDSYLKVQTDIEKLKDIIGDVRWAGALWDALSERRLLSKFGFRSRELFILRRNEILAPVLAIPPAPRFYPPFGYLLIETDENKTTVRFEDCRPSSDLNCVINRFIKNE